MVNDNDILVIGGGPAGVCAAIAAAREGAKVTIIEQKDRLGKKILSTGNGRCNLTNEYMKDSCLLQAEIKKHCAKYLQQKIRIIYRAVK